jgi:hypothetical protein
MRGTSAQHSAACIRADGIEDGRIDGAPVYPLARAREARDGTQGLSSGDVEELKRLRAENAELRMERDVLKRSVVLWVKEATK